MGEWQPEWMSDESDEQFRRRLSDQELRRLERAWREGNARAISDAIDHCHDWGRSPPLWAKEAVRTMVENHYDPKPGKQGRHALHRMHYIRWDAVKEARDRRGERGIPRTWDETYVAVSELLRGTEGAGSPDAIRKSYLRVNKEMKTGKGGRYSNLV